MAFISESDEDIDGTTNAQRIDQSSYSRPIFLILLHQNLKQTATIANDGRMAPTMMIDVGLTGSKLATRAGVGATHEEDMSIRRPAHVYGRADLCSQ